MNVEHIVATNLVTNLTSCFKKWLRFDVANGSTDFGDDYVRRRSLVSLKSHATLNFVGDVRNYLNGVTKIFSAAFTLNNSRIDLAGCHVCCLRQVDV